jgi:hypothetical protein
MHTIKLAVIGFCLFELAALQATIFGTVRGVVHDAQHLPIAGVTVTLKAQDSDWAQVQKTDQSGEFEFAAVRQYPISEARRNHLRPTDL